MPRSTQVPAASFSVSSTGLSPAVAELSSSLPLPTPESRMPALQPRMDGSTRFGLFPLRSPLLRESRLISFPSGTEMFHFPELALGRLCIRLPVTGHDSRRVSPFGNLWINACLRSPQLFAADRVLLRRMVPGHPPCALVSLIFSSILLRPIFSCPMICIIKLNRND